MNDKKIWQKCEQAWDGARVIVHKYTISINRLSLLYNSIYIMCSRWKKKVGVKKRKNVGVWGQLKCDTCLTFILEWKHLKNKTDSCIRHHDNFNKYCIMIRIRRKADMKYGPETTHSQNKV